MVDLLGMVCSSHRPPFLVVVAALAGFAGGAMMTALASPRLAHADAYASSIQVPREGLTFRGEGGRAIARLGYGAHGGVFEVLDEHGDPVAAMGTAAHATSPEAIPGPTGATGAWTLDDARDPWSGYRVHPTSLPASGL